jgi:hypothetical protein
MTDASWFHCSCWTFYRQIAETMKEGTQRK